jgi:C-terminal processing protease CtpA/Prc
VATLVNRETSGAAEAFAAVLRQAGTSLILGGKTAGQAMIAQEYPLKNGQRLRIASGPVRLGDGSVLSSTGLKPDISVEVSPMAEQSYFADAFRELLKTNSLLAANAQAATNSPAGTNRARRPRFNEAELVRERKLGAVLDNDLENLSAEPEKPIVQDPVLARALDLLKGLNLVRQSRS